MSIEDPTSKERLMCVGSALFDDPRCWRTDPLRAPLPRSPTIRAHREAASAAAVPPCPHVGFEEPIRAVAIGGLRSGHARDVERPPRSVS
jgi:hypothetical protein